MHIKTRLIKAINYFEKLNYTQRPIIYVCRYIVRNPMYSYSIPLSRSYKFINRTGLFDLILILLDTVINGTAFQVILHYSLRFNFTISCLVVSNLCILCTFVKCIYRVRVYYLLIF